MLHVSAFRQNDLVFKHPGFGAFRRHRAEKRAADVVSSIPRLERDESFSFLQTLLKFWVIEIRSTHN
jgi:hypothetical protein